jgi:hypothetical protein
MPKQNMETIPKKFWIEFVLPKRAEDCLANSLFVDVCMGYVKVSDLTRLEVVEMIRNA